MLDKMHDLVDEQIEGVRILPDMIILEIHNGQAFVIEGTLYKISTMTALMGSFITSVGITAYEDGTKVTITTNTGELVSLWSRLHGIF